MEVRIWCTHEMNHIRPNKADEDRRRVVEGGWRWVTLMTTGDDRILKCRHLLAFADIGGCGADDDHDIKIGPRPHMAMPY